ncbi:putative signal peptide protein [Burkholderia diffusa]|nr:putative signal peptide protein [Burkholderia diffusa]
MMRRPVATPIATVRAHAGARAAAWRVATVLCGACCAIAAPSHTFAGPPVVHTVTVQAPASPQDSGDPRRFMHGIGVADAGDGRRWVFFSSSGIAPRGALRNGNWPHDVYVGEWLPGKPRLLRVRTFISRPEAQEPVSIAQNPRGDIFVTFEDGWNTPQEVSQRYGVYRRDLKPIKPYPNDVEAGGHSGHVAAVGERFVVFYSADWIDGGGVDNLGTGNGVYVKTYDADGRVLNHVPVAPHRREWWPVVAGSPHRALLVWQKYIEGSTDATLEYATFDPVTAKLDKLGPLSDAIQYYVYSSAYVPAIDRFVVVTTTADNRGVAMLIDPDGRRLATLDCLPASVRESGIGVDGTHAYVPTRDGRLLTLALSATGMSVSGAQRSPIPWGSTGIAGFAARGGTMHFVSLTPSGTREADFDTARETPLPKTDAQCPTH